MDKLFLGVDTSNYTTSLALYGEKLGLIEQKRLLPVPENARGLRQSDALFLHTKALPELSAALFDEKYETGALCAVGVSSRPRDVEGSYMPCFLAGVSFAHAAADSKRIPLHYFSHQAGHIMAAVYSCGMARELRDRFIFLHVSGGTTEVLLVTKENNAFRCGIIGKSLDLNAGQVIDRIGVRMGCMFPCGAELDRLCLLSDKEYHPSVSVKQGVCSLSGLENQCVRMIEQGEKNEDTAKFLFTSIARVLSKLADHALLSHPDLPILYAGGVMANSLIRRILREKGGGYFARPDLSADNACGIALLTNQTYRGECL